MPSPLASRLDLWVGIVAEALRKSPACGRLRRGSGGGSPSQRLYSQPLRARQIPLLHALLSLELAFLCLQQPLLRALCPQALVLALALRLLRLQLLHALLQPIDAVLALHALARKDVALAVVTRQIPLLHALLTLELAFLCQQQSLLRGLRPQALVLALALRLLRLQLLHALLQPVNALLTLRAPWRKSIPRPLLRGLLELLNALLTLLRALFDPLLSRGARAQCRRCARAWWCSDLRRRTGRHGRALRRSRTTLKVRSRCCHARR
jgi:signal transduction histidine kinase